MISMTVTPKKNIYIYIPKENYTINYNKKTKTQSQTNKWILWRHSATSYTKATKI